MDILKELAKLLPVDPDNSAGYGPFRLPERARWMERVFEDHDRYYLIGPGLYPPMHLSEIDSRIFNALVILANTEPDLIRRCQRFHDVCDYWPIMRSVGHYLYGRHVIPEES